MAELAWTLSSAVLSGLCLDFVFVSISASSWYWNSDIITSAVAKKDGLLHSAANARLERPMQLRYILTNDKNMICKSPCPPFIIRNSWFSLLYTVIEPPSVPSWSRQRNHKSAFKYPVKQQKIRVRHASAPLQYSKALLYWNPKLKCLHWKSKAGCFLLSSTAVNYASFLTYQVSFP